MELKSQMDFPGWKHRISCVWSKKINSYSTCLATTTWIDPGTPRHSLGEWHRLSEEYPRYLSQAEANKLNELGDESMASYCLLAQRAAEAGRIMWPSRPKFHVPGCWKLIMLHNFIFLPFPESTQISWQWIILKVHWPNKISKLDQLNKILWSLEALRPFKRSTCSNVEFVPFQNGICFLFWGFRDPNI